MAIRLDIVCWLCHFHLGWRNWSYLRSDRLACPNHEVPICISIPLHLVRIYIRKIFPFRTYGIWVRCKTLISPLAFLILEYFVNPLIGEILWYEIGDLQVLWICPPPHIGSRTGLHSFGNSATELATIRILYPANEFKVYPGLSPIHCAGYTPRQQHRPGIDETWWV